MRLKKLVVKGMEYLCHLLDNIPTIDRDIETNKLKFYSAGHWGCYPPRIKGGRSVNGGLADLSYKLDEKWETGVWG